MLIFDSSVSLTGCQMMQSAAAKILCAKRAVTIKITQRTFHIYEHNLHQNVWQEGRFQAFPGVRGGQHRVGQVHHAQLPQAVRRRPTMPGACGKVVRK